MTVLDPASGTLTFLAEAAKLAVGEFVEKFGEGHKRGFIQQHILNNFYAFELMMAPYAVGHLKMSFLLEELGYRLKEDDRFKLYLTNTLEMENIEQTHIPGMASLSEESRQAGNVKKKQPILAIIGNPPYSGHSANKGEWIDDLLKKGYAHLNGIKDGGYYQVDGKALGERNPKWLQDDYVKFIRFAQWKIDQSGSGVLGFITNHSYLDNPTFKGMRRSLMNSFDEIYLVDLHGNSLKKETCPDGSIDKNVFDIRQGVAIGIFIKTGNKNNGCRMYHADVWGLREEKYEWLETHDLKTTKWDELSPKSELYLFVPRDEKLLEQYEKSPKVTDIFPLNGVGMTTARDKFVIDFDRNQLINRIRLFKHSDFADDELHTFFGINKKKGWDIRKAWKQLQDLYDADLEDLTLPVLYRPFDVRWIFYHDSLVWRTVKRVMRHMLEENLGLITNRQVNSEFMHALCTNMTINDCSVSLATKERSYLFPLYCYPDTEKPNLFSAQEQAEGKQPNINKKILTALSETYTEPPSPETIFYYIYAVLYSKIYRKKYAEFLKTDFPRVPFTKNDNVFQQMAALGQHLADLHLMKSPALDTPIAKFQGSGENHIDKIRYDKKNHRVYVNKEQYFEGIAEEIYQYRIGGYQVCHKWLKDRKGRTLSLNDVKHYCRIVTVIEKTIEIQNKIGGIYDKIENELISF